MRINSETGYIEWMKAFYVKNANGTYNYTNLIITENQVAWVMLLNSGIPYVYRFSDNGTILQTICFGSLNLNFAPNIAFITVISETEFMFTLDLSLQNGNISVGLTTGVDFSAARISTNLTVQYNLMIDYNNGVDIQMCYPIIYNSNCYALIASIYNGNLFASIPIDDNNINTDIIKNRTFLLGQSLSTVVMVQFYCGIFQNSNNLDEKYKDMIGIFCQVSSTKIAISYFNTTSFSFQSTFTANLDSTLYVLNYKSYNTTLVYIWGGHQKDSIFNYMEIFDTLTKQTKLFYVNNQSHQWLSFLDGNIFSEYADIVIAKFSILKTNMVFEAATNCNPFQYSGTINTNITVQNVAFANLDLNKFSILLTTKYILIFNATQTPYLIFDKYITDLFWPQTKLYGDSTICQPSGPIPTKTDLIWNLSEANMKFEVIPFTNCQGIPINVTSAQSTDLDSSAFTISNNKIIIDSGYGYSSTLRTLDSLNLKTKVTLNKTLVIDVDGATFTIIPIPSQTTISIFIQNYTPTFENAPDTLKVKISEGLNLSVVYSKYCSANSSSIIIDDIEGDSIYLTIDIDFVGFTQIQMLLDSQECEFNLPIDTTNFNNRMYLLNLQIWDIFHPENQSEITVNLNISYFVAPEFFETLKPFLTIQICTQTLFNLPDIVDQDHDFSNLEIIQQKNLTSIQNSTLIFAPKSTDLGSQLITIKLIDAEGLSNYYNLTVNVIDALKYQPIISNRILIYYPKVEIIDISKLLTQSINHTYTVKILENTHIVKWASYDPTNQTIKFSNYNQDGYGAHNLTISIYDDCFSRNFDSTIVVVISLPHPPATTGTISNITAYQGQEVIKIQINEGVFFDESETYLVALSLCTEFADKFNQNAILDSYSGKSSQINFTNFNPSIYFDIIFKKTYVGNCQSNVIATDTYLQTSLISFSINVLRCSQTNCLYCNGPKASDCTECVYGFKIDLQTKECKVSEAYIESWIIILFVIVVLLITVLSDHDLNASYILLESITLYWMLFIAFEEGELRIKYYFKQILVVLTHFNSLLFPLFDSTFIVNSNINITSSFLVNCITIVAVISLFIIFQVCQKNISKCHIISFVFRTQAVSKYMLWASTYIFFCIIYELLSFTELTNIRILSYAITIICASILSLIIYCFCIYSNKICCICKRFSIMSKIRQEFYIFDRLTPEDYALTIRYNIGRKLILIVTIILQIKIKLSPFLFTFIIISAQLMYSNLITGLCQFRSSITGALMIFNEMAMIAIVLLASVEFLNEYFNSDSNSDKFESLLLILIRVHILLIIGIETSRICWFIISKILSSGLYKVCKKHKD